MAEGIGASHLSAQEHTLLLHLRQIEPARSASTTPSLSLSERIADRIAAHVGSWRFVIVQTLFLAAWMAMNVAGWLSNWDPYPFILLNLLLSFQAAYTAPFIMMSQNRQGAIDRHQAESDYEINVQAALEIKLLHQKVDAIGEGQIPELRRILAHIETKLDAMER